MAGKRGKRKAATLVNKNDPQQHSDDVVSSTANQDLDIPPPKIQKQSEENIKVTATNESVNVPQSKSIMKDESTNKRSTRKKKSVGEGESDVVKSETTITNKRSTRSNRNISPDSSTISKVVPKSTTTKESTTKDVVTLRSSRSKKIESETIGGKSEPEPTTTIDKRSTRSRRNVTFSEPIENIKPIVTKVVSQSNTKRTSRKKKDVEEKEIEPKSMKKRSTRSKQTVTSTIPDESSVVITSKTKRSIKQDDTSSKNPVNETNKDEKIKSTPRRSARSTTRASTAATSSALKLSSPPSTQRSTRSRNKSKPAIPEKKNESEKEPPVKKIKQPAKVKSKKQVAQPATVKSTSDKNKNIDESNKVEVSSVLNEESKPEQTKTDYLVEELNSQDIPDNNNNNTIKTQSELKIEEIGESGEKPNEKKESDQIMKAETLKSGDSTKSETKDENVPDRIIESNQETQMSSSNGLNQTDNNQKMETDDISQMKRKLSAAQTSIIDLMPEKKRFRVDKIGDLFTMGEQISKELGPREINFLGQKVSRSQPARVKLIDSIKIQQVAMGALHTLILTEGGQVWSFGCNDDFVLGRPLILGLEVNSNGTATIAEGDEELDIDDDELEEKLSGKPLPVKGIKSEVVKVSAGDMHSAALCQDGKVYIWGNFKDESDKVGLFVDAEKSPTCSDYLPTILPRQVEFDMNVVDIASGSHHLMMLTDQGKVYTFGEGSKGQLGRIISTELNSIEMNRDLFLKPSPVSIPDNVSIERIFASQWNSYALTKDGVLYGWGLNNYYQLGIKNEFISEANSLNSGSLFTLIPTRIPVPFKVAQIANGQQHSLILDVDGNVYSCGSALYGKLGHGEDFIKQCHENSISEFKQIPPSAFNDERVIQVDCGDFCSMAITENGKVFCWGQGSPHIGTEDGVDLFAPKCIGGPYAECTKFFNISTGAQMAAIVGVMQQKEQSSS